MMFVRCLNMLSYKVYYLDGSISVEGTIAEIKEKGYDIVSMLQRFNPFHNSAGQASTVSGETLQTKGMCFDLFLPLPRPLPLPVIIPPPSPPSSTFLLSPSSITILSLPFSLHLSLLSFLLSSSSFPLPSIFQHPFPPLSP